ncbi:(d)CMP kinase [Xanthovirga aplysinae]|uniref:(d)CMP kinase n=1 Tax=Xanthovirga aplysinae TaxID=2529853 RepID=UPI0012BD4D09|nr:(d)CMP kinase [Xanthovirga aplysinae]MTI30442.1 (d)CMP kinase [Xanthovirga aplysinae]
MRKIVIAIDGYSACGKSSTAKEVASRLGYAYIDTGAMYRAVTLFFHQNYVNLTDPLAMDKALAQIQIDFKFNSKKERNEIYLNGLNVEDEIRSMFISERVSEVSAIKKVRQAMVAQQQKMGKQKGIVMDGRDIGTVVFPAAELKVFMTADFKVRGERRQKELLEKDILVDLQEVLENLKKRDEMDSNRTESPLIQANDAIVVDTTNLTFEDQVGQIIHLAEEKIKGQIIEN